MKSKLVAVVLLCLCCWTSQAAIQVDTNFPGGNIIVDSIDGDTIKLHQDRRDTEGWWFYWCFRVRGAAGKTLTFHFTDGNPIGVRGPAYSMDEGLVWKWLGTHANTNTFTFTFPTDGHSVRFSFAMPYTQENLDRFLAKVGNHNALKKETLCLSRKARPVERLHVGALRSKARHRVLVTCRAHCCEMMTSYVAEGLIQAILSSDEHGKWLRRNVELLVIPFVDKDGVEDGDQGKNRRPRDHNRDYDENGIYPETRAIREFVPKWSEGKLELAFDLHCPAIRGEYNEVIYLVGSQDQEVWREQQAFGSVLEKVCKGPLPYSAKDNLPFGQKWNNGANFKAGPSGSRWAASVPGVKLATTIEFPYANVSGAEVTAETSRAFGRDLAVAIRRYLE